MATFTILEPMSTGDVIDRAVRIYRRNFAPLVSVVAVPTLVGWVVSMTFLYGYTTLLSSASSQSVSVSAIWMLVLGVLGYPVWLFILLLTVSGLARVVGDHVMLGEPITFRGCVSAVRRRLGAILLMGLLAMALGVVAYIALSIIVVILLLVVFLIVGLIGAAQLPQWIATTGLVITVIVAVALGILLICVVVARIVFLPQSVMIEGESAINALGRAIRLGKGNWYRVGAIILFTYFVSLSMQSALMIPLVVGLYFAGMLTSEFFVSSWWSILYTSFGQISNLLTLPIWILSFTLLYFDSRVRKEAYDVDLLAREINPGFYWQPPVSAYPMPGQFSGEREYVQTSPLGLAGYRPAKPPAETPATQAANPQRTDADELLDKFERAAGDLAPEQVLTCETCGAALVTNARFCMNCGTETQIAVSVDQ